MSLAPAEFFTPVEFACHDGSKYPEEWADRWVLLVPGLCDPIRRMWQGPLTVLSGYRTPAYNEDLIATGHHDVASSSQHTFGNAADLAPASVAGRDLVLELHEMILRCHAVGQTPNLGGLGLYPGWVHVDTHKAPDGHLRRWSTR